MGGLCNASTPIDCPGWHLDFDSSHVLPVGDVTVDASLKDYSLPVIDQAPESLSEEPAVANEEVAPLEEVDSLGAIRNFPQTVRTTQPFSPSSGSDVDTSVVESESDTLAAVTPNNPASEVDVDLITKFEQLVLCKQLTSHNSPALNTTFPLADETTPIVQVNETASSVIEAEDDDLLPADATRNVLSETQDVPSVNQNDSELTSAFEQEECSFALLKAVRHSDNRTTVQDKSLTTAQDPELSVAEVAQEGNAPFVEEQTFPSTEEEKVVEEETAQVCDEKLAPDFVEKIAEEEPVPATDERTADPVEEVQPVEELFPKVVDEQVEAAVIPEPVDPVVEQDLAGTLEVIPAEIATCEVDQTRAEDDSTFLSTAEQTVLNAGDNSCTVETSETNSEETHHPSIVTEEAQSSAVTEETLPVEIVPSQEVEPTIVKPTSLPEEKPIVPRKGYDLSFLDRFDDLENATPSISQAKQLPSLPIADFSSDGI